MGKNERLIVGYENQKSTWKFHEDAIVIKLIFF